MKDKRNRAIVRARAAGDTISYLRKNPRALIPAGAVLTRGAEIKTVDVPTKQVTMSSTPTIDMLNGIQEGSSFYNRVGRRIHMKSVAITGQVHITGNGAGTYEYCRILLIYDRQPNGANPAISDVLLTVDNQGNLSSDPFSGLNMNNAERFLVLRDTRIDIPLNSGAALTQAVAAINDYSCKTNIKMYVPLNNLETHYKASTNPAVIGDIATGSLLLITLGNVGASTAGFALNFSTRLRFTDV